MVSFFTGIVDESERAHLGGYPAPLREVLGLRIDEFWPLPVGGGVELEFAGERHTGTVWSEWVEVEGAEVIATFAGGEQTSSSAGGEQTSSSAGGEQTSSFAGGEQTSSSAGGGSAGAELAGRPAVTRHTYGAGVAWYLATRPEPAMMRALLDRAAAQAGVAPVLPGLPDGLQAVVRHGADRSYLLLLNHGAESVTVSLPEPVVNLLGDRERPIDVVSVPPRGVAVLRSRLVVDRAHTGAPVR